MKLTNREILYEISQFRNENDIILDNDKTIRRLHIESAEHHSKSAIYSI